MRGSKGEQPLSPVSDAANTARPAGRPRDAAIDHAVLAATRRQLAASGFVGLSVAAVASEAGTTRPAIYRRWTTKSDLVVAAVADLAEAEAPRPTGEPFADLVAELEHFRHCIIDANSLALAGVVLSDGVDPSVQRKYREHLVVPRRARLRACLAAGVARGQLDAGADFEVATSMMTGSWYAFALAGKTPPRDWAGRVASLAWRSCGGSA